MVRGASGWQIFWHVTLPNIKWGLVYGVILCNARAMGEFGAVSVAAFAVASLLALLAVLTLLIKSLVEWLFERDQKAAALEVADRVVLMNSGIIEQIGSPQEVWDHPASRFVYGFLGDVNLFHGRAHEGEMLFGEDHRGLRLATPEHPDAQDAKAFAYVRPHDLEVQRHTPAGGSMEQARGIVAKLTRAIVVGPIARLELLPLDASAGNGELIEAQIPAQQFHTLNLQTGAERPRPTCAYSRLRG